MHVKTSGITIMQPSTTMIKMLVFHDHSVFDEPHFFRNSEETVDFSL